MSSRIVVDEIHGKTANASALTIDSSGRVGRTKVPAWFFVTGDGQAANVALAADPVIWGQKIHDDDGAGGTNRKATMSRLKTYMQNGLTFTTNTDVNVSKANLTTVLASYTGSDTLNIGDADDDTTVVIRGNLQVDGTTTTINSTSLTVDDKIILCADGSSSESNTGTGGLEIEVGNSTQNPFVGFVDGAALTQMVVKAAGATTSFPIAVMEFSSDSTAPTGNAGGVGSFHFDTGDDKLYVRTA